MFSESFSKEFKKTSEVLPFTKHGLATVSEFIQTEKHQQNLDWLKNVAGLSNEEIDIYNKQESGLLDSRKFMEASALKKKLEIIKSKIDTSSCSKNNTEKASCTHIENARTLEKYPDGHPMNKIKQLEENLYEHLVPVESLSKRRKVLRRLERKKQTLIYQDKLIKFNLSNPDRTSNKPGSQWDVKEKIQRKPIKKKVIGPQKNTMYTIKDNKIVRLKQDNEDIPENIQFHAENIILPINNAEIKLLEGTKMNLDDIKKIERFKDYHPGAPSKVLYLKNISNSVTQEQLVILFNQFVLANRGPIDVRLMSGRMRGQAFVEFLSENTAIQALEEVNGTILSGQPIIVEFGRNSNRIQEYDD